MALMEIMNRGKITSTGTVKVKKGSYKEKSKKNQPTPKKRMR